MRLQFAAEGQIADICLGPDHNVASTSLHKTKRANLACLIGQAARICYKKRNATLQYQAQSCPLSKTHATSATHNLLSKD
jgi:hypothetical protein